MNLTTAISIVNDGLLIGPNKGCPILYIRDEDNPDQLQALNTKEFYDYLKKQKIFRDVSSYCKTIFYLSWFYIDDNGEVKTDSVSKTLQEVYPLSKLQYDDIIVHNMYVWNILRNGLKYIWDASFPDEEFPMEYSGVLHDDLQQIHDVYEKVQNKFGDKLDKSTFIQAVNSKLQKRDVYNFTEENIEYVIDYLEEVLEIKSW